MIIRTAEESDRAGLLAVEVAAFGERDEADLVEVLLGDASAQPCISLVADLDGVIVGHILCTHAQIVSVGAVPAVTSATVLGPLAVAPELQKQGVGGALVRAAMDVARTHGYRVMTVLGHVDYYPRHGFEVAARYDIVAPYPTDPVEAFMVFELEPGALEGVSGTLKPADTFMRPEYWCE